MHDVKIELSYLFVPHLSISNKMVATMVTMCSPSVSEVSTGMHQQWKLEVICDIVKHVLEKLGIVVQVIKSKRQEVIQRFRARY